MTRLNIRKINHFVLSAPNGAVLPSNWLEKEGISPKLAWWYVKSGWLERVGQKAYKKAGDKINWAGVIFTLQKLIQLDIHIGGKTALQLLGRSHFVPMQGVSEIILFANVGITMPRWVMNNKWDGNFEIFKTNLFVDDEPELSLTERSIDGMLLQISCPERAAIEMLYTVPVHQSVDEAGLLMENLGQLRPTIVQLLLEQCNSIKAKRLFLYFAEKFNYSWVSNLNMDKINLGHGKRVISGGGKYNPKYMLSLPDMTEDQSEF